MEHKPADTEKGIEYLESVVKASRARCDVRLWHSTKRGGGRVNGHPYRWICLLQPARQEKGSAELDCAWITGILSRKTNSDGEIPESIYQALGWRNCRHPMLGAAGRRQSVSGLRSQLHASRLSGALVPGVRFIYVSLPWRCVLRRRYKSIRAAASRAVSIRAQDRERTALGEGRTDADSGRTGMTKRLHE